MIDRFKEGYVSNTLDQIAKGNVLGAVVLTRSPFYGSTFP
jgi:hypothetical protein